MNHISTPVKYLCIDVALSMDAINCKEALMRLYHADIISGGELEILIQNNNLINS